MRRRETTEEKLIQTSSIHRNTGTFPVCVEPVQQRSERSRTARVLVAVAVTGDRQPPSLPSACCPSRFWPSLETAAPGSWPHSCTPSSAEHQCHDGESLKSRCRKKVPVHRHMCDLSKNARQAVALESKLQYFLV